MSHAAPLAADHIAPADFVELREDVSQSPLYNEDLAPVPIAQRNWTTYNYAALWISMAHCIPTYMMAAGLIKVGMNWWQALITILLGNTIVLAPILLNSHPGTKYGIPFPVFARASYGTYGSNLPALMRALVACGWFGIQAWIGGEAIHRFITAIWPGYDVALGAKVATTWFAGYTPTMYISFLIFWLMNIAIVFKGMNLLRLVENWAAPFVLIMAALLMGWVIYQAGGVGDIVKGKNNFPTFKSFWLVFIPSLTGMIGFWSTLSLNMPDFTRFGRSQREQMVGQVVALPTTMVGFAAMGVVITSAAQVIYHEMLWDPVQLVGKFHNTAVVVISMFTVVVATLSVNIAANVVSPANDFANAFPRLITFRVGGLITGLLGIAMFPWKLLATPEQYIFGWLGGYSGGLGAIAGVMIADYWLIRRTELVLADLYKVRGEYTFTGGWNWRAVVATIFGCALAWSKFLTAGLLSLYQGQTLSDATLTGRLMAALVRANGIATRLYDYAWFLGFFAAGALYFMLMFNRRRRPGQDGHLAPVARV